MKHIFLALVFMVAAVFPAQAITSTTGTLTVTTTGGTYSVQRVAIAWTSDAAGSAQGTNLAVVGLIHRIEFVDDATDTPTANYDVVITDEYGSDVLNGAGSNVTSPPTLATPDPPIAVQGLHTVTVTNAGNAKSGTIVLYIRL